jgi:hypothetical protein
MFMLDPMIRRRPGFRQGTPILLADGQAWELPDPDASAGPTYPLDGLIAGIVEADDQAEQLRAELALGIYLISTNYDLPTLAFGPLLEFRPDDPSLERFQADLHQVALAYVRAHRPEAAPLPDPSPAGRRPGLFGRLRASLLN